MDRKKLLVRRVTTLNRKIAPLERQVKGLREKRYQAFLELIKLDAELAAALKRGRDDAKNGIPPREGSATYLLGYASSEKQTIFRQPQ